MSERAHKLGTGTGHTEANAKTGGGSKSTPPGKGYKQGTQTGHALHGHDKSKKAAPDTGYRAFDQDKGTGHTMEGEKAEKMRKSAAPGEGFKQGKGTGHALHGENTPKKVEGEDGFPMGKGTGHALRGKDGGHTEGSKGKKWDHFQTGKKSPSAGKSTSSEKPAPYGLHDAPVKGMEGLRHYAKDASPKGIKNVADLKGYAKKKYGIGGSK